MARVTRHLSTSALIAAVLLAGMMASGGSSKAYAFTDSFGASERAVGMFTLRIPFGGSSSSRTVPEVGIQLGLRNLQEEQFRSDRYDGDSGARLPGLDTESIATWTLEPTNQSGWNLNRD